MMHFITTERSHSQCAICDLAEQSAITHARVTGSIGATVHDDRMRVTDGRMHTVRVSREVGA